MNTLKVDLTKSDKDLDRIVKLLREGEIVAFPTETVYGLGASIKSEEGLKKIFEAKGRPADNPLIVHVNGLEMLEDVAAEIPENALKLIDAFWPGPLTLIFPKREGISKLITAGLNTVAVRAPVNQTAIRLIEELNTPIAAPSANISGRPSITKKEDLITEFDNKIGGILLGEEPIIGIESTVLDLTKEVPLICRPGKISQSEIENVIGKVDLSESIITGEVPDHPASPGMKYKHYSPKARVISVTGEGQELKEKIAQFKQKNLEENIAVITVGTKIVDDGFNIHYQTQKEYTRELYSLFRDLDRRGFTVILCQRPKDTDSNTGFIDRLNHASNYTII